MWVESRARNWRRVPSTVSLDIVEIQELPPPHPVLRPIEVLVVDDNQLNRRILSAQVARWGMTPTSVESGRAALDALYGALRSGRPYKLVLLDANMPDMDGFTVAAQILKQPALASATVMMLTSSGEYGDDRAAPRLASGAPDQASPHSRPARRHRACVRPHPTHRPTDALNRGRGVVDNGQQNACAGPRGRR